MPNIAQVQKSDTFEQWRQKTNLAIIDINDLGGGSFIRFRNNGIDVDYDNNDANSIFTITIDGTSNLVLSLDPSGNLSVVGEITATEFNGPLVGNVTGNVTGNLTGDVYASNGTTKVLENGDGTTTPATFTGNLTGNVTGNLTGNVTGNLTGNVTGDLKGDVYASNGTTKILENGNGTTTTATFTGNLTGNADTATAFKTARSISITGDATWTISSFDGSANATATLTLANSGVVANTYTKVTVDAKGRITSGTSLTSTDVTTALGFTPLANNGKAADSSLLNGVAEATAASPNTIMKRDGSGNTSVNFLTGTAQYAQYADLAEKYTTDKEYKTGTVMIVASGLVTAECTQSFAAGQFAIGVISEKPAFLMNSESEGQPIALKGRVPVRVVGQILKGQPIMASHDGTAIAGSVNTIGIALETDMEIGEKLVECIIL